MGLLGGILRSILIFIISVYLTGCSGGSDTGDSGVPPYGQDARIAGPEVGWRPVDLPGGFALE
jgi:hypothetical protein